MHTSDATLHCRTRRCCTGLRTRIAHQYLRRHTPRIAGTRPSWFGSRSKRKEKKRIKNGWEAQRLLAWHKSSSNSKSGCILRTDDLAVHIRQSYASRIVIDEKWLFSTRNDENKKNAIVAFLRDQPCPTICVQRLQRKSMGITTFPQCWTPLKITRNDGHFPPANAQTKRDLNISLRRNILGNIWQVQWNRRE